MAGVGRIHKAFIGRVYFMMNLSFSVKASLHFQDSITKYRSRIYDYETLNCMSKQMWRWQCWKGINTSKSAGKAAAKSYLYAYTKQNEGQFLISYNCFLSLNPSELSQVTNKVWCGVQQICCKFFSYQLINYCQQLRQVWQLTRT